VVPVFVMLDGILSAPAYLHGFRDERVGSSSEEIEDVSLENRKGEVRSCDHSPFIGNSVVNKILSCLFFNKFLIHKGVSYLCILKKEQIIIYEQYNRKISLQSKGH
jgi:hypothetical protein